MIEKAILQINPNARFTFIDDDIDSIEWLGDTNPIPKNEIESKISELQAEYDAKKYQRDRKKEYPSHEDCIHALLDGGDTLTELQEKRQAVKTKYPKL